MGAGRSRAQKPEPERQTHGLHFASRGFSCLPAAEQNAPQAGSGWAVQKPPGPGVNTKKDHGKTVHHRTMISILKRDNACPALPAGHNEFIVKNGRNLGADPVACSDRLPKCGSLGSRRGLFCHNLDSFCRNLGSPARPTVHLPTVELRPGPAEDFERAAATPSTTARPPAAGPDRAARLRPALLLAIAGPSIIAAGRGTFPAALDHAECRGGTSRRRVGGIQSAVLARCTSAANRVQTGSRPSQATNHQNCGNPAHRSHLGTPLVLHTLLLPPPTHTSLLARVVET